MYVYLIEGILQDLEQFPEFIITMALITRVSTQPLPKTPMEFFISGTKAIEREDLPEDERDCPICLEPFEFARDRPPGAEPPQRVMVCSHLFGSRCLIKHIMGVRRRLSTALSAAHVCFSPNLEKSKTKSRLKSSCHEGLPVQAHRL